MRILLLLQRGRLSWHAPSWWCVCVVAAVVVAGVTYLSTGSSPQFPVVYAPTTPRTNPRDRSPENVVSVRPYSLFDTLLTPDVFFLCVYCRVDRAWFAIRVYYSARHPLSLCRYFRCVLYAYGRSAGLILVFSLFSLSLSDYIRSRVVLSSECSPPPHRVSPAAQAFADFIARYPELLDMHLGDQAFHVPCLWGALERDAGVATEPGVAHPRRPAVDWFGVSYRSAFRCCNDRDPDVRTGCHWVDSNVCSPKDIATTTCVTVGCSEQNPKFMHEGCKKPGSNDVCCRASPNSRVGSKFWVFDDCSVPCIPAAQRCNTNLECCSKVCLQLDSKWNNAKICAKWKQQRQQGPFVDSILEQTRVHKPSICISMKRSCYASVSKYRIYEGIYCLFLTCWNRI